MRSTPGARVDAVVADASDHLVAAVATDERVVAGLAVDPVVAAAAGEAVAVVRAGQRVVATAGDQAVPRRTAPTTWSPPPRDRTMSSPPRARMVSLPRVPVRVSPRSVPRMLLACARARDERQGDGDRQRKEGSGGGDHRGPRGVGSSTRATRGRRPGDPAAAGARGVDRFPLVTLPAPRTWPLRHRDGHEQTVRPCPAAKPRANPGRTGSLRTPRRQTVRDPTSTPILSMRCSGLWNSSDQKLPTRGPRGWRTSTG